jgi:hypothetical protein
MLSSRSVRTHQQKFALYSVKALFRLDAGDEAFTGR